MSKEQALRYNDGKVRLELLPQGAIHEVAKIFTYGANKYTVKDEDGRILINGANNWRTGLPWMSVIASCKRHLEKFISGEDLDEESGNYHLAHAATNLLFLLEYYKIAPQFDDRLHTYLKPKKIGLDIDEVLADWVGHWTKYHNMPIPEFWNFDRDIKEKFLALKEDKEFWLSIPPKVNPKELGFEPHCYITSRNIPNEWTEEWLTKNGFNTAPVYTVAHGESKVNVAKESGLEWFLDDRYENFVDLNKSGICCFLMDAPHNKRYDVGFKRIMNFADFKERFL